MNISALLPHRAWLASLIVVCSFFVTGPVAAQDADVWTKRNHPENCPYTEGDQAALEAAGFVSWGGFEFGTTTTQEVDKLLPTSEIRWLETEHFEIGLGLGHYKVPVDEKKRIRAELTELAKLLPEIKPKQKTLDPWLRLYMFGARLEAAYDRFQEIMQVTDDDFPKKGQRWVLGGSKPYMGEGPYMGMNSKFEVLILPSETAHVDFLRSHYGLQIKKPQRYNTVDRGSLILSFPAVEHTRVDTALHGAVVFNIAINLLDGFKFYAYDTPIWLREGLAHLMEREISPKYNSFDSSEGAVAQMTKKSDWTAETAKMVRSKKAPTLASLVGIRTYAELELPHHFATWSMTKFLVEEHPEKYAKLNGLLHGIKNESGMGDGTNMKDKHRDAFKEAVGMSYREFDTAWQAWATTKKKK